MGRFVVQAYLVLLCFILEHLPYISLRVGAAAVLYYRISSDRVNTGTVYTRLLLMLMLDY